MSIEKFFHSVFFSTIFLFKILLICFENIHGSIYIDIVSLVRLPSNETIFLKICKDRCNTTYKIFTIEFKCQNINYLLEFSEIGTYITLYMYKITKFLPEYHKTTTKLCICEYICVFLKSAI